MILEAVIADVVGQYPTANTAKLVTVKPALIMVSDQFQVTHHLCRYVAWSIAACKHVFGIRQGAVCGMNKEEYQ